MQHRSDSQTTKRDAERSPKNDPRQSERLPARTRFEHSEELPFTD